MKWTVTARWVLTVAALLLLVPSPSRAQGFKWWNSDQYRHELGLTADQSRRLEDIFQAALPGLRAAKKALDDSESEFGALVQRGDDAAVMSQLDRVETARGELSKTRTKMLLKMRRVLTTDQWIKLGALERERRAADAANQSQSSKDRGQTK